jgi:hypothetical protein
LRDHLLATPEKGFVFWGGVNDPDAVRFNDDVGA